MKSFTASRWLLMLPLALLSACGSGKDATDASTTPTIKGVVLTEDGKPVFGAAVSLQSLGINATTDSEGAFTLVATRAQIGDALPLLVVHPDYSRLSTNVPIRDVVSDVSYKLRAHGVVQTITLPASATDAPVTVSVPVKDGGTTTLTIAAGALELADHTPATGAAQVKLTYWHPNEDLTTAPAPLEGTTPAAGGTPGFNNLYTYGMASIEISQGNAALQVASGKTLGLTFLQPDAMVNTLTGLDSALPGGPMLWFADETTGMWALSGDGAVTYNPADKTIAAQLPHLSSWNIDGVRGTNLCVTGKVTDKCGKPEANADLTLWVAGGGQLAQYNIRTGADGSYCGNLTGSSGTAQADPTVSFHAWISNRKRPAQSVCNPTGESSYNKLCNKNDREFCAGSDQFAQRTNASGRAFALDAAVAKCNSDKPGSVTEVKAKLCGYCPGTPNPGRCLASTPAGYPTIGPMTAGACTDMGNQNVAWCGTPPPTDDICTAGGAVRQGKPCQTTADCCPDDKLVCADGLCLPNKDSQR